MGHFRLVYIIGFKLVTSLAMSKVTYKSGDPKRVTNKIGNARKNFLHMMVD